MSLRFDNFLKVVKSLCKTTQKTTQDTLCVVYNLSALYFQITEEGSFHASTSCSKATKFTKVFSLLKMGKISTLQM
jgi:hypothetical protein